MPLRPEKSPRPRLSLVVRVKDEWGMLDRQMRRMRPVVDEAVWVLDRKPGRRAAALARRWKARILVSPVGDSFSRKLNDGIAFASGDWVLAMDVDELISRRDLPRLRRLLSASASVPSYLFARRNYSNLHNLWHDWRPVRGEYPAEEKLARCAGYWRIPVRRLFRRLPQHRFKYRVHEFMPEPDPKHPPRLSSLVIHHFQFQRGKEGDAVRGMRQARRYGRLALLDMRENRKSSHPLVCRASELLRAGALPAKTLPLLRRASRLMRRPGAPIHPQDPGDVQALLAGVHLLTGNPGKAVKSLRPSPMKPAIFYALMSGTALGCSGRWKDSGDWFRRALRRSPDHPVALNGLGLARLRMGRKKRAIRLFRRALRANPHFSEARKNLAETLAA